jgi:hypothetical protein
LPRESAPHLGCKLESGVWGSGVGDFLPGSLRYGLGGRIDDLQYSATQKHSIYPKVLQEWILLALGLGLSILLVVTAAARNRILNIPSSEF